MKIRKRMVYVLVMAAIVTIAAVSVRGLWLRPNRFGSTNAKDRLIAFNLTEAERQLRTRHGIPPPIAMLGGLTRLMGLVYNRGRRELILIGRAEPSRSPLDLDSLVVAMRAVLVRRQWPLVSIDPTADTETTGQQTVRLEGGIADSRFGQDFLLSDVRLKRLGLGLETATTLESMSYFRRRVEQARREARGTGGRSRFWFYAIDPGLEQRDDVFLIRKLALGVRAETKSAAVVGRSPAFDAAADEFASAVTGSFPALCRKFADLDRLQSLYEMVAVARGMQMIPEAVSDYWLNRYAVAVVPTPRTFAVVGREERVDTPAGPRYLEVRGGIQFRALTVRLIDGDVTALKEAVLLSRPARRQLVWSVPINIDEPMGTEVGTSEPEDAGSSFDWQVGRDADQAARRKEILQKNIAEIDNYLKQARPEFLKPLPIHEGGYHSDDGGVTNYHDGSDLEKASQSTGNYHSNDGGKNNFRNDSKLDATAMSTGMYHADDGGKTFKLNPAVLDSGSQSGGGSLCISAACVGPRQATADGITAEPYTRGDLNPYSLHRYFEAGYTVSKDGKVIGSGYGDVRLLSGGHFAAKQWNGPGYQIYGADGKTTSDVYTSVNSLGGTGYFTATKPNTGKTTVFGRDLKEIQTVPTYELQNYLHSDGFQNQVQKVESELAPEKAPVSDGAPQQDRRQVPKTSVPSAAGAMAPPGGIKADINISEGDFHLNRRRK